MNTTRTAALALAAGLLAVAPALQAQQAASAPAAEAPWLMAGRQGIVRLVIVPEAQALDRAAYQRQLQQLCPLDQTCFVNFYTNTQQLPLAVPLPDAVQQQATVIFRRSIKQGAELFSWSCRLQVDNSGQCF